MKNSPRRNFLKQVAAASLAAASSATGAVRAAAPGEKIKIGQIGTAHAHASGKMSTMRKLDQLLEVVGVVEKDKPRRLQASSNRAYRDVNWMSEEQLLNVEGLQAVAVETGVRELVPTAARCVAAGVHVHLDKPAGESLSEFSRLLTTATASGLVVQMGYMFRYNPAFRFLFRAVREGWLGSPFELHGVISKTVDRQKRAQLAQFAGGSMFELGCHLIDALVYVMGKPEKVTPFLRRSRPDEDDLADNTLAVFEYPKATATIRSALVEVDGSRRRQFVICGDAGTIAIQPLEPPRLKLTLAAAQGEQKKGTQEVELPTLSGRYDGDFLDLARMIRGEKPVDFSPSHDLAVHEAVLRASATPFQP